MDRADTQQSVKERLRECRQRWAAENETWRVWVRTQVAHADHPDHRVRWHIDDCVKGAWERKRWWVAARRDIAARARKAELSGSMQRMVGLHARWLEDARTMEALADEDPDSYEARECYERARTLTDCANDLARTMAGMKPNHD